ncbi:MAG: NnrU family protein [Desulfobulbaceae bacterium]|nr:NnrU family protein [Desulfobulbaceae bacterium]
MKNEIEILFWWLMFGGSHIIGSSIPVRTFFIRRLGILVFKVLYSLVAIATFIPLCYVYFTHRHAGFLLYTAGYSIELLAQFLMLAAIIVLLQGLITTNPMTTLAELTGKVVRNGQGIQRVTRHPQNFAFGLFGLAHLLANPYVGDWIFFGGFIVYGILSAMHQDRRMLATGPAQVKQFLADTSAVPFAAIIRGRQRLAPGEYYPPAMAAAIVLFILMRLLHPMLFGGFGG